MAQELRLSVYTSPSDALENTIFHIFARYPSPFSVRASVPSEGKRHTHFRD